MLQEKEKAEANERKAQGKLAELEEGGAYQTKKEASCMTIAKYQKRADDAAQKMVDCQVS